jgi:hypothetical protein
MIKPRATPWEIVERHAKSSEGAQLRTQWTIAPRWGFQRGGVVFTQGVALGFDIAHLWCFKGGDSGR